MLIMILFVFVISASGCTDKEDVAEKQANRDGVAEYTNPDCGNNACDYYRLTLKDESGGGAIYLNGEYHTIMLKSVDSKDKATICIDRTCDPVELRKTKDIGGVYAIAESIIFSKKNGESSVTLTFGENAETCPTDCVKSSGYCGDGICNAQKVTLMAGEEKEVTVDGATVKVKLASLVKDTYEFEITGPGEIKANFGGRGAGRGGVGQSIPIKDHQGPRVTTMYADTSEMIGIGYAVTEILDDSVTIFLGDETETTEICPDCYSELKGI
ncbi:MAG: hypothetical protein ABIG84_00785 [archaeon]